MSVSLAVEGMDALALAQEGERLCRENSMKAGLKLITFIVLLSHTFNCFV